MQYLLDEFLSTRLIYIDLKAMLTLCKLPFSQVHALQPYIKFEDSAQTTIAKGYLQMLKWIQLKSQIFM